MRKLQMLLVIVFVTMTFMSCNTVLLYRMEVLRPGYVVVPSDKSKVILVDRSMPQNPSYGHAVLDNFVYKKDTAFITDSLSGFLINSVANDLQQEGFFKNIRIHDNQKNSYKSSANESFQHSYPLTTEQIKEIGTSNKVDLIISLDDLTVQSKTNVQPCDFLFRATRDVSINTVWRVYDASSDTLISQFQHRDSLYWQAFQPLPEKALESLPVFEGSLPEIGDVAAENISRILGPYWEQETRYYFCAGSYRMKYAADCIRSEDWKGASALWLQEYDKGFGRSVYRAAMNMMLYYEIQGDIDQALVWSKKTEQAMIHPLFGVSSFDLSLFQNWKEAIQARSLEYEKLKVYFNGKIDPTTKE